MLLLRGNGTINTQKCLIIAAGLGSRLAKLGESKPLVPLLGRPLIEWVIENARKAGLNDFYVVTGYNGALVRPALDAMAAEKGITITHIINEDWEKANGLSVLKAKEALNDPFILLMSDHLCDPEVIENLRKTPIDGDEICLAVDFNINSLLVDMEDVTRVQVNVGQDSKTIAAIGKNIKPYNGFDTGMFLCTPAIFQALEECMQETGATSLSAGIQFWAEKSKVRAMDIHNAFWLDVDDPAAFALAEKHLKKV